MGTSQWADPRQTIGLADIGRLAAAALARLGDVAKLDEEAKAIVSRAATRLAEIAVESLGASDERLKALVVERDACLATLAGIGAEKASELSAGLMEVIHDLATTAIGVVLARV